jgi:hypothetical protein
VNIINRNFQVETATISSLLKDFYVPELEGLIGIECFNRIAKFTQRFPENLSPFFGYEIQLGTNIYQADFLFCVSNPSEFRNYVDSEMSDLSEDSLDLETIDGLNNFSAFWLNETENRKNQINNIWFEFDYNEIEKSRPKSCFFFGPKLNVNKLEVLLLTERVFNKIFNKQVKATTLKTLLEIYHFLEKDSYVSQIGMMNSRNDENLRLFIQGKSKNWILAFLQKMNYSHTNNPEFLAHYENCMPFSSTVDLDIDISSGIGENLGLECYFTSTENALLFLEYLVEKGLSTIQKSDLLKKYLLSLRPDKSKPFQPFFSHFKLVFKPGSGFFAKAYFGYVIQKLAPKIIQTKPIKT